MPPDPELEAISDRLGEVSESLGFTETDEIAERRAQLLREINIAGGFDRDNQVHVDHLRAYQDIGRASFESNPRPEAAIGYHIAMARVWLEADNPDGFYDYLYGYEDDPNDRGAITMLRDNGLVDALEEVKGIVEYLESRNTNQPEA